MTTCDWTRAGVSCESLAVVLWTRTGHRNLAGELMAPDGIEHARRCDAHPMGERFGWTSSPISEGRGEMELNEFNRDDAAKVIASVLSEKGYLANEVLGGTFDVWIGTQRFKAAITGGPDFQGASSATRTVHAIAKRVKAAKIAWDKSAGSDSTERNRLYAAWEAWTKALGIALLEAAGMGSYTREQADTEGLGWMNAHWRVIAPVDID